MSSHRVGEHKGHSRSNSVGSTNHGQGGYSNQTGNAVQVQPSHDNVGTRQENPIHVPPNPIFPQPSNFVIANTRGKYMANVTTSSENFNMDRYKWLEGHMSQ